MNTREKMALVLEWLNYQDEQLSFGLRSMADAEKLYDFWQVHSDNLPEMADEPYYPNSDIDVVRPARMCCLGYDPMEYK